MNEIEASILPTGWALTILGEVGEVITGNTPPTSRPDFYQGRIPFIKPPALKDIFIRDVSDTISEEGASHSRRVPANSVLVSCIGNLGKTGLTTVTSAFNQQINAVVFADGIEPKYGFYACQLLRPYLEAEASSTTISIVNKSKFSKAPIRVAPLNEQRRIVAEIEKQFSRLDAAVVALKRVQANLKRYRAAVLRAACEGRLVPTEAELARQEGRDYEPADVLLQRILSERRAQWEADQLTKLEAQGRLPLNDTWKANYQEPDAPDTTKLVKLPEGWSWTSLGQIAEVQGGIQKQPSRTPKENIYPFLRVANVLRGRLNLTEVHGIELFNGELTRLRLYPDDLLIVEGNGSPSEIGRMAIWPGAIPDCVHQNHIIRARPLRVRAKYVETYWNSPEGSRNVLNEASSTSGLHTLSVSKVNRLPIPLPPLAEQTRIVAEVERCLSISDEVAATVAANLKRAERLRQSILQRAFSGKLVHQDPSDESASVLLDRIQAERDAKQNVSASTKRKGAKRGGPEVYTPELF